MYNYWEGCFQYVRCYISLWIIRCHGDNYNRIYPLYSIIIFKRETTILCFNKSHMRMSCIEILHLRNYCNIYRVMAFMKVEKEIIHTYGLVRRWIYRIINSSKVIPLRALALGKSPWWVDNYGYPHFNQTVNVL